MSLPIASTTIRGLDNNFRTVISVPYVPEDISDVVTPNWITVEIPGRSSPIKGYNNTSARVISFSLELQCSVDQGDGIATTYRKVFDQVNSLRTFLYPTYDKSIMTAPPARVLLTIGDFISLVCLVNEATPTWKNPISPQGYPMAASVSLAFEVLPAYPPSMSDMVGTGNLRWQGV